MSSKLKVTLEIEELQKMLEEAARLGSDSSDTWTDYTETGIAFTIVSDYKVLSRTFIEEEKLQITPVIDSQPMDKRLPAYAYPPTQAPRPIRDAPQA